MKNIIFNNGVLVAPFFIPNEICEKIIQTYNTSEKEKEEELTDLGDSKKAPNVNTELPFAVVSYLKELVSEYSLKYDLQEKPLHFSKSSMILGYDEMDECPLHYDSPCLEGYHRYLVVNVLLNEDYEGGEFFLPDHNIIKKGSGTVIIFPANFMFKHGVLPVVNGKRYSLITSVLCNKDFSKTQKELGELISL